MSSLTYDEHCWLSPMKNVVVVLGPGSIGQAIARRVSAGKHVLLADPRKENADAAAKNLSDAGFDVSMATVDVSSRGSAKALIRNAGALGEVVGPHSCGRCVPYPGLAGDNPQSRSLWNGAVT
ncbi:MAG: SDR family NAD(P)-dependent oxidoreductase [Acetobacteraceae bacterium]|nr:SDR family NAD(P)-dependent oxidoreductase [Acetobacteraceae bacterium]